jgi:urea transport system substrate-binding protein
MAFLLSMVGIGLSIWFKPNPILIGVLHSQTGTMAFSEKEVLHATLAAIEDVNANGGVLGRPLKAIIVDGASNEKTFAQQAQALLLTHKVPVIFGGWTSAQGNRMKNSFK